MCARTDEGFHCGQVLVDIFNADADEPKLFRVVVEWNLGIGHWGAGFNAEVATAIGALVEHFLVAGLAGADAAAMRATATGRPDGLLDPVTRRIFGGEHIHHLDE
ncbi:MAG: hypothetical protein OXE78_09085 [Gammaproteobacteria bacterium]|nr:hypothetical protein [Gammaproteobacteria bacterium]